MSPSRREFMKGIGVMLASLLTTRCTTTCYTPVPPEPTCYTAVPTPSPSPSSGEGKDWDRLRQAWYGLDRLARDAPDLEKGERTHKRLVSDHQTALNHLVGAGQLDPTIADDMQAAFEGAAYHVWRANAPITCYEAVPYPDYQIEGSSDLARQADLLAEMAETSDIDPATIAQAQAAIERDIAFLAMTANEQQALIETVRQAAGDTWDLPHLAELNLDVPPESAKAARILVEVLLERK
jgi:hypothetical protein